MATSISVAQQNAHADLAADALDAGGGPGYVEVYTGAKPATVATTASGTLIVTITLNDPAYGDAGTTGDGVADLDVTTATPSGTAVADGTPGWFRTYTSDGTALRDSTIAGASPVATDDSVEISEGSLTVPASSA